MDTEASQRIIRRILRVNHSGEHGAVSIYNAQRAYLADSSSDLQGWLTETLGHEARHRSMFSQAMPSRSAKPCRALGVWSVGGRILGGATALLGKRAVMICTAAVERTVHAHLEEQARFLDRYDPELAAIIRAVKVDEDEHLAYAEARHDRRTLPARALSFVIAIATETLIAISTRGDSLSLARSLRT
jgi:ubiquinone biosynthesis monooxygenase Coq7